MPGESPKNQPQKRIGLFDAVCIIVGIIIGAGIFETTPLIAGSVSSVWVLLGVFALGGLISLVGALCYAELTTTYPREGGDFLYLRRAFGRRVGFLFAWCEFWVVRPGNIGLLAYVFARYANEIVPLNTGGYDFRVYACGAVIVLTAMNILGVQSGKWTQNVLTAAKVLGLTAIVLVGLIVAVRSTPDESSDSPAAASAVDSQPDEGAAEASTDDSPPARSFRRAMILVMLTFGGWTEISYVAAEVRQPQRNLFRALVFGTTAVTLIYLLVVTAFVAALGFEGVGKSQTLAVETVKSVAGSQAGVAISLLVCISCLGAVNGTIFAGARVFHAVGQQHQIFAWLAGWHADRGPVRALVAMGLITIAMICLFGPDRDGFQNLVVLTSPFFWTFLFLVSVSLFVLRRKDAAVPRSYRVWLFPITPLLFCGMTLFMLVSSSTYAWSQIPQPWYGSIHALWPCFVLASALFATLWVGRTKESTPK